MDIKSVYERFSSKTTLDIKQCPKCHKKTLWIKDNYFKCFKPNCEISGNDINYLSYLLGISSSEAKKELYPLTEESKSNYVSTQRKLNDFFNEVKQNKPKIAVKYFEERGWNIKSTEWGYCDINCITLNERDLNTLQLLNYKNELVFQDRILFPITNIKGDIVYFQGRSLNPESNLRWLTSSSYKDKPSPFNYFFNTVALNSNKDNITHNVIDTVFLCEGISDALSLIQLGVNVISSLNLYPPLLRYVECLKNVKQLIVIYDNDKHYDDSLTGNKLTYKSWSSVLSILTNLQVILPELKIYCCVPPEQTGITDINEWLLSINYNDSKFSNYLNENNLELVYFLIDKFLDTNSLEIMTLLKLFKDNELNSYFKNKIQQVYNNDWIQFFLT